VELYEVSVTGAKEPLTDEAAQAAKDLVDLIRGEFLAQGRTSGPMEVGSEATTDPQKLFRDVWIRQSYDRIGKELYRPGVPVLLYSGFSLGESATDVATAVGADALLFVKCFGGRRKTGAAETATKVLRGLATFGLSAADEPLDLTLVGVVLVDGKTGDLLWANRTAVIKANFSMGGLTPLVKTIFKTVPK
jgi:hypothetical protein